MGDAPYDVEPRVYATVLREMIRHENDVTNHRIMWLLIGQGLIANVYVGAFRESRGAAESLAFVGILITLSTYLILYKSYQARGYLEFLGGIAQRGALQETQLPLMGWPKRRIRGWRRNFWMSPWLGSFGDLLEPYLFLPILVVVAWMVVLIRYHLPAGVERLVLVGFAATSALFIALSVAWVWWHQRDETEPGGAASS